LLKGHHRPRSKPLNFEQWTSTNRRVSINFFLKKKSCIYEHHLDIKLLMQAIAKKETKRSLELLEEDQELDPNELVVVEMFNDKFTWSPLHAASYYGDMKLVEALIQRGANVELNDTWYSATPLGWAAFGDKDKVARLLIQKYNANTKAKNVHGQVPFDVVSDQDDPRWIGLFKEAPKLSIQLPQKPQQQIMFQQPSKPQIQLKTAPFQAYQPNTNVDGTIKKRRGRPPKSETDLAAVRPTAEIDINTFDPVAFEIELFNAIRTHTDNT
jgi:ankyrin repeat protein